MKNILRKLHIGGNNDAEGDATRIIEGNRSSHEGPGSGGSARETGGGAPAACTVSPTALSTSPASAESNNKLITLLHAVKDSVGRVNSNALAQVRQKFDSSDRHNGGGGDADSSTQAGRRNLTPPGSFKRGGHSPTNQTGVPSSLGNLRSEDDYQLRMAMELSYQSVTAAVVVENEQIETAKRISLGRSPASGNPELDAISFRYWAVNTIYYDDVVPDGFYDVSGLSSDSYYSERMPLLSDLQRIPVSETSKIEAVLVDRRTDADLVALERKAMDLTTQNDLEDVGLLRTFLAQKIALMVADQMGGPVSSENDMLCRWQKASWNERSRSQSVVVSLGSMQVGLTRHRALLFKVLADCIGIPCQLVKGRHYPGVEDEGAVNIIKVDDHREYIIDLMGAPGALIPSDKTVALQDVVSEDASYVDASPKSMKTEHSSSFVSSAQSSPSSSTRSIRSEMDQKERKESSIQKGTDESAEQVVTSMALENRHHSEPTDLQFYDSKHPPARPSHPRSPSWTEGIGLPGGRQTKASSTDDISQLVIDAAKENPELAQKLHEALLERGVIAEIPPIQLQGGEDRKSDDEKSKSLEKKIPLPPQPVRKKTNAGYGRPPSGSLKTVKPLVEQVMSAREELQRLDSVEGLGDRRPLETFPVGLESPPLPVSLPLPLPLPLPLSLPLPHPALFVQNLPVTVPLSLPLALPVPVPVPVPMPIPVLASSATRVTEEAIGLTEQVLMGQFAAKVAATAAVVASSMVAASRGHGGDLNFELPVAAASTATAAVIAGTAAVAGLKLDGSELPVINVSQQRESDVKTATNVMVSTPEGVVKEGKGGTQGASAGMQSETGRNSPNDSQKALALSEDGLDGQVSAEEERNSENFGRTFQKRYDAVIADVAEWEIPWEDIVIGDRIGLGSYGEVYRGDWHGSEVAVKKFLDQDLSGDALEEFRSEVRIMRRLRHPNVVLFMGAVTRAPNLSIVTEFLPRGSLYRLIHRPNSQLDDRRRLRMALDIAKGMNYLHSGNPVIVHRDLKSPNLLVDKNWVVKVCDFGLSRTKNSTFLSSKSTAGTPEWMAPEMLRNEPSNEKCDVYSFGVILWELATLQQPWNGMNPMQVVGAVGFQQRRLDIPPEMDPGLAKVIRECWHDNPSRRPSFSQLMAALRPLQRPMSATQSMETPKQKQPSQGNTIQSHSKDLTTADEP